MRMKMKIVVIAEKNGKRFGYVLPTSNKDYFETWLETKDFEKIKIIKY